MSPAEPSAQPTPASRLGNVHVGLREDLEVTRHVFRGAVAYIVRDPVTFQSQRLDPADYELLVGIHAGQSLAELFAALVQQGKTNAAQEDEFYQFIMQLHRLGFLHLPIADSAALYRRHERKRRAKRKEKLLSFLFLRIPLWCPNAFLDRTIRFARPLFSRAALAIWLALIIAATIVAGQRWAELREPLQGVLVSHNLVLMWLVLIVLKVFHEFGHAYACKHFGGYVPEMGAYLILFTPCAYVDATASWGFTQRRHRIIVCLAGMYIESTLAAVAVFVWAMTDQSLLHNLAYNVIFLAGVVTVLFNVNPLMRYDGYYILSDLVEVPNLRARSKAYVLETAKRLLLRVSSNAPPVDGRLRFVLLTYGVAATMYRTALLLAIAAILATRMAIVGLGLGILFLGSMAVSNLHKMMGYLWHSKETAPVRRRAIAVGVVTIAVLPAVLIFVPMPSHVVARGVLGLEHETVVRAKTSGFLVATQVENGTHITAGQPIAQLADDTSAEEIAKATAGLQAALIRRDAFQIDEPDRAAQEEERAGAFRQALEQSRQRLADLEVRAPHQGRVVRCLDENETGRFLNKGMPVATVGYGQWEVRAILTEAELLSADPQIGDPVEFRAAALPGRSLAGEIARVAPAGSRIVNLVPLTHWGGGTIAVDPQTGEATQPYFELAVHLSDDPARFLRHGMTGYVRLQGAPEPLGLSAMRRLNRFVNKMMRE